MIKGTHLLRSALLALLALAVISGGSLAAGDLFDDDYSDCPHKTRLRDGQISDLSVNRDSDEADEVNVSWAATDPSTWGLGDNAYRTSLVVILNDGTESQTETLSLGSRSVTFKKVDTGTKVTVQLAIVVDTADGDYLISDILDKSINQSLTKPSFSAGVSRVTTPAAGVDTPDDLTDDVMEVLEMTDGTFYYVGYNENFGNYKEHTGGFDTIPSTARLRIGLKHSTEENPDDRDDVDFDAYIVRIADEDGDIVSEADDVKTMKSNYASPKARLVFGTIDAATALIDGAFSNVRINDGGTIRASVHDGGPTPGAITVATTVAPATSGLSYVTPAAGSVAGSIFASLPDEHRDLPVDVFASDETYTITAWAINDDGEVISPVASLKVRPIDERLSGITGGLTDYNGANAGVTVITITEFTVLK